MLCFVLLTDIKIIVNVSSKDETFLKSAVEQAKTSLRDGGIPIGAILVKNGEVIAKGHNRRVQSGDPTAHAEMDCIRNAGRRSDYSNLSLYTTLSPCMMCTGTIIQFGVGRVVIGDVKNFKGNLSILSEYGIGFSILENKECENMMGKFIENNYEIWKEDIGD